MKLNEKKVIVSFEVMVMMASLFAFSYFVGASEEIFNKIHNVPVENDKFSFAKSLFGKLKEPMIPVVSAEQINTTLEDGSILIENITKIFFNISSDSFGAGCCALAIDGQKCATWIIGACSEDALFT